jgi:hypothetical protein
MVPPPTTTTSAVFGWPAEGIGTNPMLA